MDKWNGKVTFQVSGGGNRSSRHTGLAKEDLCLLELTLAMSRTVSYRIAKDEHSNIYHKTEDKQ